MTEQRQLLRDMGTCPLCAGELHIITHDVTQEGVSLAFPIVTCRDCNEGYLVPGQMQQMADAFAAFGATKVIATYDAASEVEASDEPIHTETEDDA